MTVLCNTQDGHFDIDLKEVSSLKGQLVEAELNPRPKTLPREPLRAQTVIYIPVP